jgi:hypothetical protein
MVDLRSRQIVFEQEIYFGFRYQELASFFHSFEVEDCACGLSFAEEAEGKRFAVQVQSFCKQVEAIAKMNQVTASSAPPLVVAPKASNKSPPASSTTRRASVKEEKKEKKKGGFLSKLFGGDNKSYEDEFVLSAPTGFRHESHIGWDPTNGFDIRNIPPEWKALFKAAGVKKSELQDAETAQFVMNTVADTLLQQQTAPPPPPRFVMIVMNNSLIMYYFNRETAPPVPHVPSRNAPPPPPVRNEVSTPFAPPPPPRPDTSFSPPPPAPSGGPPPPPPPAFEAAPVVARGGLLDEIQKVKEKKFHSLF